MRESKSTFNSRERGDFFEQKAIQFFEEQGFQIWRHRFRIWGVEHDFVVSDAKGFLYFVEVKSLAHPKDLAWRVRPRQRRRLLRSAAAFLEGCTAKSRGVWLLAIEKNGKAHFHSLNPD